MTTFREDANLGKKVPQMKTDDYNDKSVTTQKIADEAVTTKKIAKNAITSDKISDDVVEELKESAKIAEVSASVGEKTGTPTVNVTHSRNSENKTTINFSFDGLKGEQGIKGDKGDKGEKGDVGEIGNISVSITNTVGTPSATASTTKRKDGYTDISLSFDNLKGEKGDAGSKGEQGLKGDTGEQGIQGVQGERGEKGETGAAAGFGEVTATVDDVIGTPSVSVSTSGDNTAKNITFAFSGLKGEKGDRGEQGLKGDTGEQGIQGIQGERGEKGETGAAAGFGEVTATVDDVIGTPSVSVSTSGDNTAKNITFAFSGLKGEQGLRGLQGERGEKGEKGEKGDKGDKMTLADLTEAEIEELQEPAIEAAKKAETAAEGAEKVNVELAGNSITVTDRNGDKSSIKIIAVVEKVTVTVTSQVDGIKTSGLKVNVFLNNGKTPQTYTTDTEGKCTFTVDKGSYYEVTVPEYANAQPLSPIGYTASIESRDIAFDYVPYDEETSEKVIVTVTKYVDKKDAVWQGKDVKVKYDNKTTTYSTDEKGQAIIYVPYKKEYTVTVDNEDGYMVYFGKNSRTYTARVSERRISVKMYQFKTGIFVMDANADSYTIEEWQEAGKSAEDAVAVKVADYNLMANNGTFLIRTSDLQNMSKLVKLQWCTQNLQFTSIALNGNTSSDANYWNGEQSTFLVKQEAEERSLSVPAFNYVYNQTFEIGDNIGDIALHGFVMSVGQEYVHIANAGVIRDVLTALYGEDVGNAYYKFVNGNNRWTSTQSNATSAWSCSSQAYGSNKNSSICVLPVFAC